MLGFVEDLFGDIVNVGDTVIASRPAGAGTTELEFCELIKVNPKSVSLRPIEKDFSPKLEQQWDRKARAMVMAPKKTFSLMKGYGARNQDSCNKIVRHTP